MDILIFLGGSLLRLIFRFIFVGSRGKNETEIQMKCGGKMNKSSEQTGSFKNVILYVKSNADRSLVQLVEKQIKVSATNELPNDITDRLVLRADADGLALVERDCIMRGDFAKLLPRLSPNNLNRELLVRASKSKGIHRSFTAVDATAGLGEDAFLLAAAGFKVQLYERNPVIAVLLYDALRRGSENPELASIINRMELYMEDSITAMPQLNFSPDIVVLDPMFPQRKKSGLTKKKFQLLHQLEQPCADEEALLNAAISCKPYRIVIKRPLKGAPLAGMKPSYTLKGDSIRYDCIVCKN